MGPRHGRAGSLVRRRRAVKDGYATASERFTVPGALPRRPACAAVSRAVRPSRPVSRAVGSSPPCRVGSLSPSPSRAPCRAAARPALRFLTACLREHRRALGTRRRRLNAGRQALLTHAHLAMTSPAPGSRPDSGSARPPPSKDLRAGRAGHRHPQVLAPPPQTPLLDHPDHEPCPSRPGPSSRCHGLRSPAAFTRSVNSASVVPARARYACADVSKFRMLFVNPVQGAGTGGATGCGHAVRERRRSAAEGCPFAQPCQLVWSGMSTALYLHGCRERFDAIADSCCRY